MLSMRTMRTMWTKGRTLEGSSFHMAKELLDVSAGEVMKLLTVTLLITVFGMSL